MKKTFSVLLCLVLVCCGLFGDNEHPSFDEVMERDYYGRPDGFVPTEEVAIKLAEVYFDSLYGEHCCARGHRPYNIQLEDGVWRISGTLPKDTWKGGSPYIEIRKKDGAVLCSTHFR